MAGFSPPGGVDAFWQRAAHAAGEDVGENSVVGEELQLWDSMSLQLSEEHLIEETMIACLTGEPAPEAGGDAFTALLKLERKYWAWKVVGREDVPKMDWSWANRTDVLLEALKSGGAERMFELLKRGGNNWRKHGLE